MFPYHSVYLAGLISTDYPRSLEWREEISPIFNSAGWAVITPMHAKKDLKMTTTDGGISTTAVTSKSIITRDRADVRRAQVILAHLETFGSPRPMLGTVAELAWAWDQRTPVIGIADKNNYLMRKHPFMAEFVTEIFETEREAADFIIKYYGGRA